MYVTVQRRLLNCIQIFSAAKGPRCGTQALVRLLPKWFLPQKLQSQPRKTEELYGDIIVLLLWNYEQNLVKACQTLEISTVDCVQFPKYKDFDVKVIAQIGFPSTAHPFRSLRTQTKRRASQTKKWTKLNWQLTVIAELSSWLTKAFKDPTWWSPYWKVALYNPSL